MILLTRFYKVNDIATGFRIAVQKVFNEGNEIKDERGSLTKELLNLIIEIKNPLPVETPEGYFWSGEKLEIYKKQFLSKDSQDFVYTYGNRLRKHFISGLDLESVDSIEYIDQIQEVVNRLKENSKTRRAISVTWDPSIDTKKEEVPCMILVDFKIRNGKLHTTALWRSHDIFGAWVPNAAGLVNLSSFVAECVGVSVGAIVIQSISAHIYEVNYDDARNYI